MIITHPHLVDEKTLLKGEELVDLPTGMGEMNFNWDRATH